MFKKTITIIVFLLITQLSHADSTYDQFCGTQANNTAKELQAANQGVLDLIKTKVEEYNKTLAGQTLKQGIAEIEDRSVMLKKLLQVLTDELNIIHKDPNKNDDDLKKINFEKLCQTDASMRLCQLLNGKRTSIDKTIKNYIQAIISSKTPKNENFTVLEITTENEQELKKLGITPITDEEMARLDSAGPRSPQNTPEQFKLLKDINDLYNLANFKDVEKLKKFIAEKYVRTCPYNSTQNKISSSCSANTLPEIFEIQIADQTLHIVGKLSNQAGLSSTFSKADMESYKQLCDRHKNDDTFKATCALVAKEYKATQKVKEPADWAEIHKHNYVITDPLDPEKYTLVPKKDNTDIFLETIGPAFASFAPFWIQNINSQNQINMMTQQAMMTKQAQVNYNAITSGGYFQANYLPGATTGPSLSNPGYNFGP